MYLSQQDAAWAAETMEKIKMKMKPVTERSRGKIPYTTVDGVFDDRSGSRDISWWTNGFWGGMMWIYEKRLQFPVNIKEPNAKLAQFIMSQYGGPECHNL